MPPRNVTAHIHVSWLEPCKVRRTTIVGSRKMVVYNDVQNLEKIKIYDKGVEVPPYTSAFGDFQLSYRYGDITIPHIAQDEPLRLELQDFVECIRTRRQPKSSARLGPAGRAHSGAGAEVHAERRRRAGHRAGRGARAADPRRGDGRMTRARSSRRRTVQVASVLPPVDLVPAASSALEPIELVPPIAGFADEPAERLDRGAVAVLDPPAVAAPPAPDAPPHAPPTLLDTGIAPTATAPPAMSPAVPRAVVRATSPRSGGRVGQGTLEAALAVTVFVAIAVAALAPLARRR